jgi:lysophospholipid acyltransferase (LPLAT)-like uncharacterized protein
MRAQPGVAAISAATGAPVIPVSWASRRGRRFDSWDRFVLPIPFDRGLLIFGAPIPAPTESGPESIEAHRRRIETALNELTVRADSELGLQPVEPAAAVG